MFDSILDADGPRVGSSGDEDWFDPAWLEQTPGAEEVGQIPAARCAPSGWLALELDQATADAGRLSDADLIDAITGFERVASWAGARQARLVAEFARRRPEDPPPAARSRVPSRCGEFAPDEIGLALRLSRPAASARVVLAQTLVRDLPATLAAWQRGDLDSPKVRAIAEAGDLLAPGQREVLEQRVLPRAGQQTLAQLRAALARAVLAIDPHGAEARHQRRRQDRRVVISPDQEGMASLWALLSAPDATAAYERLGRLARGLGGDDPRGMDARRADLLVELLTGRRCAGSCSEVGCADGCLGDGCARGSGSGDGCAGSEGGCAGGRPPAAPGRAGVPRGGDGPGKPLVSVIVPLTMLLGLDDQPGELVGYGPIPAELAREIAAEGTWRRLLTDPVSGTLLDYGRTTYTPPPGLADHVRARDVYCRFPTCGQPARRADLDHTVPYGPGPTSAANLSSLCRHHHRAKTHGPGWHVEQHSGGRVTWTTPTGHAHLSDPHDYQAPPAGPDPPPEPAAGPATDPAPPPF